MDAVDAGSPLFGRSLIVVGVSALFGICLMVLVPPAAIFRVKNDPQTALTTVQLANQQKPNFILIVADDLAWNSIGYEAYDIPFATPELTKLSAEGIRMTNYYAQEYCNPSRAALLTGRYPLNMGIQYGVVEYDIGWGLRLQETLLPEVLREYGYSTHMLGKWHLGHFNERYLPTARGFQTYTGYVDGQNEYFSKRDPGVDGDIDFRDFLTANTDCYYGYDGPNMHNYSTHLYRDLAVDIINSHDQSKPLFLYLAFQAVHIPYEDNDGRKVDKSFMKEGVYDKIMEHVVGTKRQYYTMALNIMDSAVENVRIALENSGMLDNTYIIFASDNGGCYKGGGMAYPFRGTKFSMLEGGTRVDSFIYSPLIDEKYQGTQSKHLMHVSDWFPTILELADIDFTPEDGFSLDGVSQVSAWESDSSVRETMVYNSYTNVEGMNFDMWTNGCFAVRNERYKLIHFNNGSYAEWHDFKVKSDDDDDLDVDTSNCTPSEVVEGDFTYALYDLIEDPYEQVNLYYDDSKEIVNVKEELYSLILKYNDNSVESVVGSKGEEICKGAFKKADNYVVPWVKGDEGNVELTVDRTYPSYCGTMKQNAFTTA